MAAAAATIDDIVNPISHTDNSLEAKAESSFFSKAWATLKAGVTAYLGIQFVGINSILSGFAFSLGAAVVNWKKKIKNTFVNLMNEFSVGTVMGTIGSYFYDTIYKLIPGQDWTSRIYRALTNIFPATVLWMGAYYPVNDIIKHDRVSPSAVIQEYKESYPKTFKDTLKYLGIPLAVSINMPPQYQYLSYPQIVVADTAWRIIRG